MENNENAKSSITITAFDRFIPDGVNADDFRKFSNSAMRNVPTNANLLVIDRFDQDISKMEIRPCGLQFVNPVFYKSIFVPTNSTKIDYAPNSNDVGGFKFQTDVKNSGMDIELDPVVEVKIVDPIKYLFASNNVLASLRDLVLTVMRGFAATHTANEIIEKTKFSLSEIDPTGAFEEFKEKYGLKIMDLELKNAKLPDKIKEARMATDIAKESINKAKYENEAAEYKATANAKLIDIAIQQGMASGLTGQELINFVTLHVNMEMSKNPNAHVFINGTGNNNSFESKLLFEIYSRLYGMDNNPNNQLNNSDNIIDTEAIEEEPSSFKRRKLLR